MRHRKRILLLAGSCAAIGLAWLLWHDDQPRADGYTLDHWLFQLQSRQVGASNRAHSAIATIGTNAIPYLLELVDYDSKSRHPVQLSLSLTNSLPAPVATRIRRFLVPVPRLELAQYAASGFRVLGTAGVAAIPKLSEKAQQSGILAQRRAIACLVAIGGPALPTLADLAKSPDHNVGCYVMVQIYFLHGDATPFLPVVISCLASQDRRVANCAGEALAVLLMKAPTIVIPSLIAAASTNRPVIRQFTLNHLPASAGRTERLSDLLKKENESPYSVPIEDIWEAFLIISTRPNETL